MNCLASAEGNSISASGVWLKDNNDTHNLIIHGLALTLKITASMSQSSIASMKMARYFGGQAEEMTLSEGGWQLEQATISDNLGTTTEAANMVLDTSMTPVDFARTTQGRKQSQFMRCQALLIC